MTDNENTKKNENVQHHNDLTYEDQVLEKIANYSVQNIDGILELKGNLASNLKEFFSSDDKDDTKGVTAEVGKEEVAIDLEVVAEYGKSIPKAFENAIEIISSNVEKMTGLKVVEVNMNVNDVVTRAEWERQKNEEKKEKNKKARKEYQSQQEANESGEYSDGSRVL